MEKDLVITLLTNKLGDVAQKLFHLGHEYKLADRPFDAKIMNRLAGEIWATMTQCEVEYQEKKADDKKEGEKRKIGF